MKAIWNGRAWSHIMKEIYFDEEVKNRQKENKNKNSDYGSSIIYETESVTNADTDFTMAATVNADNEAAKKIKDSGIEYYLSLTTAGTP